MTQDKPVAILVNPAAGSGGVLAIRNHLFDFLQIHSINHSIYEADWPDSLDNFCQVVLIGGDGTLNFFINRYPGTAITIGLIAAGSGNDFAWKIYGNISVEEQLHRAFFGDLHAVDAGTCNERYFLNGAGIGFDGAVVKRMKKDGRWLRGWLAYYAAVLKTIFLYRSRLLSVTINDGSFNTSANKTFMLTIANGSRYGGNFVVAPGAKIDDGLLELVQIKSVSVVQRYYYLPRMKKGRHIGLPFVNNYQLKSLNVVADRSVPAHLDGEFFEATSFTFDVLPGHFTFRY